MKQNLLKKDSNKNKNDNKNDNITETLSDHVQHININWITISFHKHSIGIRFSIMTKFCPAKTTQIGKKH